MTIKTKLLL